MKQGLASFTEEDIDSLNYANLKILEAACYLKRRSPALAVSSLDEAWNYLEAISQIGRDVGLDDEGSGIHSAYAAWWRMEAKRRRLAGEGETEIEALEQGLSRTRRGAAGWQRIGWDAAIMRALNALADALERRSQITEANQARTEAEEIRRQWRLPRTTSPRWRAGDRLMQTLRCLFLTRN